MIVLQIGQWDDVIMNRWCSFDWTCHFILHHFVSLLNPRIRFFCQLTEVFLSSFRWRDDFHLHWNYSNLCLSDIVPIMLMVPCLMCVCEYRYIFWFAPWTTKAHSFFSPLMLMYICACMCEQEWTSLQHARYYARIMCALSLVLSPLSLSFSVKINQMMELMSDRLSWIDVYVCVCTYGQNHYIKPREKDVSGRWNKQTKRKNVCSLSACSSSLM